MRRFKKVFTPIILIVLLVTLTFSSMMFGGCANKTPSTNNNEQTEQPTGDGGNGETTTQDETGSNSDVAIVAKYANCQIYPVEYPEIKTIKEIATETSVTEAKAITTYASEVHVGSLNNNKPVDNGVIVSPYYTLKINGEDVVVYGTRSANGIHSFVYIDVVKESSADFNLNIQISVTENSTMFKKKFLRADVLPQSSDVTVEWNKTKKTMKSQISDFGSFSYVLNESHVEPLTIFVQEKVDTTAVFGNKTVQYIEPGDYSTVDTYSQTQFSEENKVYFFKKGVYKIDQIKLPSNSVMYCEPGSYFYILPLNYISSNWLVAGDRQNVVVTGRGLFDASICCGSELDTNEKPSDYPYNWGNNKGGVNFHNVTNVYVEGLTVINSQTWTLCFNVSRQVHVNKVMFFAYRVYADGVMLANCQNGLIENSFIRTGDDAFETKSTNTNCDSTSDILFRYNDAWTDKAVAYGCIFESTYDQYNVRFENCSVGFALGNWSEHLGSCVIQLGQNWSPRKTYNVVFENIEIYKSNNVGFINCYIGGTGGRGDGAGTIENIYFKNITCLYNTGSHAVNLQIYGSDDCFINDLYLDNIVNKGIQLTEENKNIYVRTEKYVGGYDMSKLHFNTNPTQPTINVTVGQ